MQLQFFFLPELILHKYSVEGYCARACSFPIAIVSCGVCCTRASLVRSAGARCGVFLGVYVYSLGERAAPPRSWSRALTAFYGPLYLPVTCSILFLPEEYSRIRRIQRFLVRQWIRFLYEFSGSTCVFFGSCDRFSSCSPWCWRARFEE